MKLPRNLSGADLAKALGKLGYTVTRRKSSHIRLTTERNGQHMETAKKSWAFYPEGGIEVKTTCGSVPTATKTRRKPQIGDQRTSLLTGADWKAHHRETNRLLGLFWDCVDGFPPSWFR